MVADLGIHYNIGGYGDTIVAESLQQDEFVLICSTELKVIDTDFIFRDQRKKLCLLAD